MYIICEFLIVYNEIIVFEKEFSSANVDMVEVNQNGDNLDGICRLCGNYDSQLMSTFSGAGISNYLYEKIIQHLTAIKVKGLIKYNYIKDVINYILVFSSAC